MFGFKKYKRMVNGLIFLLHERKKVDDLIDLQIKEILKQTFYDEHYSKK